uniref:Hydrolase_4 domain-containing protein n=1 Tax=Parastrongyloides trichosuri TaxID=131310 RepID=A0A0N4ZMY6_PARTI
MVSLNLKNNIEYSLLKNDNFLPTLIIAVEDDEQDSFLLPLTRKNRVIDNYNFLQSNNVLHEENIQYKRMCNHIKNKKKLTNRLSLLCRNITNFFFVTAGVLYLITPPTRKCIVRKTAFHPPERGRTYFLSTYYNDKENLIFKSANEAFGYENLILILPTLTKRENKFYKIYNQISRTTVKIIENKYKTKLVTLHCKCLYSNKVKKKSPYLIIFSQPNSSDLGCIMTSPFNFVDIADLLNVDVVAYDYSGFGLSESKPGEKELFGDIEAVYEYSCNELGYLPENIILLGYSMGTAVSIYLGSKINNIGGLILLAPFTSLLRILFKNPFKEKTNMLDQFVSVDHADKIKAKTLIIHGISDSIISVKHSMMIYKKLVNPVDPLWIDEGTHQSIFSDRTTWERIILYLNKELNLTDKWKNII